MNTWARNGAALALCLAGGLAACGAPPRLGATSPGADPSGPADSACLPPNQSPAVAIRLLFRSGFADDPPDRPGLTALTAELMTEGGTVHDTAFALKQRLFPWAATLTASVDADTTVFEATVPRDRLDAFLPILADVLTAPRFEPAEFERLRRDAVDDITQRLRANDDENLGKEALAFALYGYGAHPYGHPAVGTVAGLKATTLDEVRAHAARVFVRSRLTIGLAGGYAPDFHGRLSAALAALPQGAPQPALPPVPAAAGPRVLLVEKDSPAVAISLGAPVAYDRRDPDFFALMVGISAFGEHREFHGRLMRHMREERGLNYGDYAYAEHFVQEGWSSMPATNRARRQQDFSIWLRPVQPEDALFALRFALDEYERLLRDGLSEDEVRTARQFLGGYTRLWLKNDQRRLGIRLDDLFYGTPDRLARFHEALPALDAARVNAALRRHLPPVEALRAVLVTPHAAAVREALLSSAPSPKKYASEKSQEILDLDARVAVRPFGLGPEDIRIVSVESLF